MLSPGYILNSGDQLGELSLEEYTKPLLLKGAHTLLNELSFQIKKDESYLLDKSLHVEKMSRGMAWFDTGTFESLQEGSSYIRSIY